MYAHVVHTWVCVLDGLVAPVSPPSPRVLVPSMLDASHLCSSPVSESPTLRTASLE